MASPPATPPSRYPRDAAHYRFKWNSTACEFGESYYPGGYHPVHLGDVMQDRYRIIRKLGYGAFSTVWLAVDFQSNCFVALKIAIAGLGKADVDKDVSLYRSLPHAETQQVVLLRDFFEIAGPNGRHTCSVLEPMGPNLTCLLARRPEFRIGEFWEHRFPKQLARRMLRDILLGLHFMHSHGVVHGDLHLGNVLGNIPHLEVNAISERKFQHPADRVSPLRRLDGKADLWAPSYLLEPAPLLDQVSLELDPVVKITDLGAAFSENQPPTTTVTPVILRAPEVILGLPFGKGIDIWCFGCLLFELLTGQQLFIRLESLEGNKYDEEINDQHLMQFSQVIGPLPEELFSRWRRGDKYFGPDGKLLETSHGSDESDGDSYDEHEHEEGEDWEYDDSGPDTPGSPPLARAEAFPPLEQQLRDLKPDDMDESEEGEVLQLLRWILVYDASKRPSAQAILGHPWFSL